MQESPAPSPLAEAVSRVGDRWTLLLIEALLPQARRFKDLLEQVPGIAPNILSQRLKHLEREALVVVRPYSQRPPRLIYELTGRGQGLAGALRLLGGWAAEHSELAQSPRHAACGTALESRWYCPTCAAPVEDLETDLHFI
ncbi:MAG: winged helix-turn-helix transcriptional regulator [Actinomycetota bacterium]